jgi:hypothetical protein
MKLRKATGTANDDSQETPPNHSDAPESKNSKPVKVEESQSRVKAPTQRPTVEESPRIVREMQHGMFVY